MFPQGTDYIYWQHNSYRPEIFNELSNLIDQAYRTTENVGISFYFDLGNEMLPPENGYTVWTTYLKNLWGQFIAAFGTNNSVGFSVPLTSKTEVSSRLRNVQRIYGSNLPPTIDLHFYFNGQEGDLLREADKVLDQQGLQDYPIIIGETNYNDSSIAASLSEAIKDSSVDCRVLFLTRWPKSRTGSQDVSCDGQNVQPPLNLFDAYSQESF